MNKKSLLAIISGLLCALTIFAAAGVVSYAEDLENTETNYATTLDYTSKIDINVPYATDSSTLTVDYFTKILTEKAKDDMAKYENFKLLTTDLDTKKIGTHAVELTATETADKEKLVLIKLQYKVTPNETLDLSEKVKISVPQNTDSKTLTLDYFTKILTEKAKDETAKYENFALVTTDFDTKTLGAHAVELTANETDNKDKFVLIKLQYTVETATTAAVTKDFSGLEPALVFSYGDQVNLANFTDYLKNYVGQEVANYTDFAFASAEPDTKKEGYNEIQLSAKAADGSAVLIKMSYVVLPENPNLAFKDVTYDPDTKILSGTVYTGTYDKTTGEVTPSSQAAVGMEITIREVNTTVDAAKVLAAAVSDTNGKFTCDLSKVAGIDTMDLVSVSAMSKDKMQYSGEVKYSLAKKQAVTTTPQQSDTPVGGKLPQTGDQGTSASQFLLGCLLLLTVGSGFYFLKMKRA